MLWPEVEFSKEKPTSGVGVKFICKTNYNGKLYFTAREVVGGVGFGIRIEDMIKRELYADLKKVIGV